MQKTIQNLALAFIGESQARNRYTFYGSIARKDGYEQMAEIFILTAEQEKEHAKKLFEAIQGLKKQAGDLPEIKVEAVCPTVHGPTAQNLKAAIEGENYEHSQMYPRFAAVAREEGLNEIAARLLAIAEAEKHHEKRYQKILKELETGTLFKKEKAVWWVCRECGYQHFGAEPPEQCPSCEHARGFYQLKCEEY
ncbi:MAG: rubrerythrin family protein [Patescibacteria group bacterium]|nr:rubrerythrin family protein [Patescibacteria group bacterium]